MDLFKYNPTPYVNTQVDLPLDFLQGQLEVKQKEFDAQTMAVDKAAENFLKINPGMLTAEAYERVKKQYLPEIEKIRDTLHQTGNIAMAAPALSKFTMNLASDPEVKNIMEDYKLTQAHNQAMQEGRYTKFMLPGLFNKEGALREQVKPGQTVQSSWYAPYEHVDPVQALLPEVEKLRARISSGTYQWFNPATNETVTDKTKLKILEPEIIAGFVRDRKSAYLNAPESKGYVIGATDWGSRSYTDEDWERDAVVPLSKYSIYEQDSDREARPLPAIQPPSDGSSKPTTPPAGKAFAFTTVSNSYTPQVPSFLNNEIPITSQDEIDDELKQAVTEVLPIAKSVFAMTGVDITGRSAVDVLQNPQLLQQAKDNWNSKYVKNKEGHYIPREVGTPNVTYQQEEAFNRWEYLTTAIDAAKTRRDDIKKAAGVTSYDPAILKKAKEEANGTSSLLTKSNTDFAEMLAIEKKENLYDRSSTPDQKLRIAETILKENPNSSKAQYYINTYGVPDTAKKLKSDFNAGMTEELKGTPEGKIYKVWDELNNRMEQMQMVNFDNDKSTENILQVLLTQSQSGQIPIKEFVSDKRLDKLNLDEEFTAYIPINKTTGLPDYSQINLGMAFDRKDGLVGIVSMSGKQFEFDISKNPGSNLDKLLIEAHPELKEPTTFFHQVYQSLNQTSGNTGKFTLGSNTFMFDHKSENLGKGAPKFEYEYDFDGTGKKRTTNLYEIYSAATGVNNSIIQANNLQNAKTAIEITNEYNSKIAAAGYNRSKIEAANNWYRERQTEALKEQLAREKASSGQTMGKGKPQAQGEGLGWK
jgi:hypothetical protein